MRLRKQIQIQNVGAEQTHVAAVRRRRANESAALCMLACTT
jgi:hypothetical protein